MRMRVLSLENQAISPEPGLAVLSKNNAAVGRPLSVLSYVYSKQPIFGLTQEWFREMSFSRLECGVHDKWWDLLLPMT